MLDEKILWDEIKDKIVYRLVSADRNREKLKTMPHRELRDLAVIYCASIYSGRSVSMTIPVTDEYMERWGTTEEELYQLASENTPRLFPPVCISMEEMMERLQERMKGKLVVRDNCPEWYMENPSVDLYVLTNSYMVHGAAAVLYPGVLEKAAEQLGNDLVVLPSSIHEMMLLPYGGEAMIPELSWLVREVNRSEVAEDEVLSDHLYVYRRDTGRLEVQSLNGEEVAYGPSLESADHRRIDSRDRGAEFG